jgi:uncharacterized protein YndB with AHSA1/START domain
MGGKQTRPVKATYGYVIYIETTPEKVWKASVDGEITRQYWHPRNRSHGPRHCLSFIKFRTDASGRTSYPFHEGFSPRKSIRKLRQIMKGEQK